MHEGIGWLHVFTGDTIKGREREALAIEPVTCPPGAFNSGTDLVVLEPGAIAPGVVHDHWKLTNRTFGRMPRTSRGPIRRTSSS